jgi:two-component system, NtrC family, response regulator AlgB
MARAFKAETSRQENTMFANNSSLDTLLPGEETITQSSAEEMSNMRVALAQAAVMPLVHPRNTRMRRVMDRARHLAANSTPILLGGETGVGKRVLAQWIHEWGLRPNSSCVFVSAASSDPWPANVESSDFQGTVVFEGVGEFSLEQQARIWAMLCSHQDQDDSAQAPIKILATTSEDLHHAARKGQFREDALSLLMDESLYLPPLRERPEDIAMLADHLIAHFGRMYHRPKLCLEAEARLALARYSWPGNLDEFRNALERVAITSKKDHVGEAEFRLRQTADSGCGRTGEYLSLDALEKQQILRVIRAAPTLEEAARILKVDISTLWRKRRRYGI